jgi:hypothetical protein
MIGLGISAHRLRPRFVRALSDWWHQFDDAHQRHRPLHANQLHLRGL